jgi:hypothetical protein
VRLAVHGQAAERAAMALRQPAIRDRRLHVGMQVEQAQRVRDRGPCLAHSLRDVFLGQAELLDQLAVGERLVDRVEVGALHVLDERDLQLRAVGELANERGDPFEADQASRSHASLAGDELVPVQRLGDEDGLEHTVLPDACRELLEDGVVDPVTWLVGVGRDPRQRHLDDRSGPGRPLRDQRR